MLKPENFDLCMTEIFGPFQVLTEYTDDTLEQVLEACERIPHHLTAAVVSNNLRFMNKVLGRTVNGTTYAGLRARTTGAPQNHCLAQQAILGVQALALPMRSNWCGRATA